MKKSWGAVLSIAMAKKLMGEKYWNREWGRHRQKMEAGQGDPRAGSRRLRVACVRNKTKGREASL